MTDWNYLINPNGQLFRFPKGREHECESILDAPMMMIDGIIRIISRARLILTAQDYRD